MRKKDDILGDARNDIMTTGEGVPKSLWIEYRKLEVFIDIRDLLQGVFNRLADIAEALQDKH